MSVPKTVTELTILKGAQLRATAFRNECNNHIEIRNVISIMNFELIDVEDTKVECYAAISGHTGIP